MPGVVDKNSLISGARLKTYEVTDVKNAAACIKRLCKRHSPDAVSKEDFMAFLEKNIIRNPKIIEHIKEWAPDTFLVGFKFMVNYGHKNLIKLAREKAKAWGAGLVVANDKSEMEKAGKHVAHLVRPRQKVKTVKSKDSIVSGILTVIEHIR